jgi:hypothetical protein
MINMNLLLEDVETHITKMPAAEFGGGGIAGIEGHIYELRLSPNLAFVLDEQQLLDLTEAALDVLPDMRWQSDDDDSDDDKGESWKQGGQPA